MGQLMILRTGILATWNTFDISAIGSENQYPVPFMLYALTLDKSVYWDQHV